MHILEKQSKYFGLLTLLVEWGLLLILFAGHPSQFAAHKPLSDFLGIASTRVFFMAGFALASLTFWIFVRGCLATNFTLTRRVFGLSLLSLLVALLLPYNGTFRQIHIVTATLFMIGYYAGTWLLGVESRNPLTKRIAALVICGLIAALATVAAIDYQAILYIELSIGLFGHLWIILITRQILTDQQP